MKQSNRADNAYVCLIALSVSAGILLSGCNYDPEHERYLRRADTITLGAGNAAAFNAAVHTIDPWPWYAQNANVDLDGKKALIGIRRYQHDDVRMPRRLPYPDRQIGREDPPLAPTTADPYGRVENGEAE